MYKKPFLLIPLVLIFLSLLLLQIFVYATQDAPDLELAKKQIDKLIDSGKSSAAAAMEDKIIADNASHPALPKIISDMADSRAKLPCHDYNRAKALYNRLIQEHPQSNYAKRAGLEISKIDVFSKMETGNLQSADGDVEQIITANSAHPYLPEVLYEIAERYTKRYYFKQADALYERSIKLSPAGSYAEKAKFGQIKNNLFSDFKKGGESVEGILNDTTAQYPGHKQLPGVLYFAADKYEENFDYPKAKALYEQTLAADPNSSYGRKSVLEVIKIDIYEKISDGNFPAAQALTEQLITEHQSHSYLPEVLYNIADYYRKCRNHGLAKQVYSRLIALFPQNRFSARGQVEIALLDIRAKMAMGTFDPAAGELERFVSGREKEYLAARRLYELGEYCLYYNYESAISVFDTVCRQFPDFTYYYGRAKICADTAKIGKDIKAGNLADAQTAIAKLKQDYAGYCYLPGQLYFIAREYLNCGEPNQAGALCDEVIAMDDGKYATHCSMFKYRLDIHSRLQANDLAGAKQLVEQFKAKYKDSLHLTEGTLELTEEFYNKGLYKETIAILQDLKPADADFKIAVFVLLAHSNFGIGNFTEAASYYQKIINQYPDCYYSWPARIMTGRAYEKMPDANTVSEQKTAGKIDKAKGIFQQIIDSFPADGNPAVLAQAKAHLKKYELFSAIESGKDEDVEAIVNLPAEQLGDANERLDVFLNTLAVECAPRGYSAKAQGDIGLSTYYFEAYIRLEERLFTQCPNSPLAAEACFVTGVQLAQEFEDYAGAGEYFRQVFDTWPGYKYAGWAQLKIGNYLEEQVRIGELSAETARPLMSEAYQKVINNYPKSKWAVIAQQSLERLKRTQTNTDFLDTD